MADTMQRCEGGVDNSSAGSPSSVSDETDPAGVVLEARVVQARVPQFEIPTLSPVAASRHGRLHPKDGTGSYSPHKSAGRLELPEALLQPVRHQWTVLVRDVVADV